MELDADDEILQDFMIEAGELLERLNEQLVELEQSPDDSELLNSVFRNFHTIKGGASFLSLTGLVEVCHQAEDVFNVLRQGERQVSGSLMDVVLQALDVVNGMFAQLQAGEMPEASADPVLIKQLSVFAVPDDGSAVEATAEPDPVAEAPAAETDMITDEEFDALLDDLQAQPAASKPEAAPAADPAPAAAPEPAAVSSRNETISDDEFEALLDELQGADKTPPAAGDVAEKPQPAEKPAPVKAAKPAPSKPKPVPAETTVRVDTKRLDDIMNLVGELVLVRNRMETLKDEVANEEVTKAVANLDLVTADLQTSVMKTRMQPIKKVFGRFPRVVRDLARSLNREVTLELQGEETDLDKNLVEALADPLVHLVRNAVDHGIEPPDEREAAGKPRVGTVVLAAEQEGDHILLTIEDDGKGMDPEVLRRKVVEKGLMDADTAARMDSRDCYNLIFMPGFSTKTEVSDVSGRGVGMDVVKTRINQLNGHVEIDSTKGKGSRLTIRVPLTLAIMPTLMVVLGDQTFALPLSGVNEIFNLDETRTNVVDGQLVVRLRERAMPIFYLGKILQKGGSAPESGGHIVVVTMGAQKVGFVVDQLIGQEEVVIKPLGAMLQKVPGFAGATITGDGRIALIIDVPSLMKSHSGGM